jgi:hypothetical protein
MLCQVDLATAQKQAATDFSGITLRLSGHDRADRISRRYGVT